MSNVNGAGRAAGREVLRRSRSSRILAGVCGGIAEYSGVDATLVRALVVVISVFSGMGVLAYLATWIVIPEEGQQASITEDLISRTNLRS